MAKSLREELQDLGDWLEILRERLKEGLSEDMPDVYLLGLLVALIFVIILGGVVISSTESVYGPVFSRFLPTSWPTTLPTSVPATPVPTGKSTPTLMPVVQPLPTEQAAAANGTLPGNNTTLSSSPTTAPIPTMPWSYGGGEPGGPAVNPTPSPEPTNGSSPLTLDLNQRH